MSRYERLEVDLDLRLGSLWAELLDKPLSRREMDIAAAFMRAAYAYGYSAGQQEMPYALDDEIDAEGGSDGSMEAEERRLCCSELVMDLRLAALWPDLILKGLEPDVYKLIAVFCRSSYAGGYFDGQDEPGGKLAQDNGYTRGGPII